MDPWMEPQFAVKQLIGRHATQPFARRRNKTQTRLGTCMHVLYRRAQARSPDELDSAGSLQAVFKPSFQANTNTLHFNATL